MKLNVDLKLQALIPPLDAAELSQLEANLIAEGCRDKLVVWQEENVIVDGHNRYAICTANKIPFETHLISFANRDQAEDWIDRNAIGKRNLKPGDFKIIAGRMYDRRKKSEGASKGNKNATKQLAQVEPVVFDSTAEDIANELGVSRESIKRHVKRATVHDAMVAIGDTDAAEASKTAKQSTIDSAAKKLKPPKPKAKAAAGSKPPVKSTPAPTPIAAVQAVAQEVKAAIAIPRKPGKELTDEEHRKKTKLLCQSYLEKGVRAIGDLGDIAPSQSERKITDWMLLCLEELKRWKV